jgi:hypothetical protein
MSKRKLDVTVVTATNLDLKYLDCVPFFIQFWLDSNRGSEHSYTPLVILVADKVPQELEAFSKYLVLHPPVQGVPDVFISQFIRCLYSPLCRSDLVITSDVDMLPLSTRVFDSIIASRRVDLESFDVCRDVLGEGQFAICYNIATPSTWKQVVGTKDLSEIDQRISDGFRHSVSVNNGYVPSHGGKGWFSDQEYLYSAVQAFKEGGGLVRKFSDSETSHSRLDRLFLPFPINWFALPWVYFGAFTDYHVHHPIRRYRFFVGVVGKIRNATNYFWGSTRK